MGRTIYAIILTFIWLTVLMLWRQPSMTPAALVPVIVVVGAWLAANGKRIGYVAFCVTSIALTFLLGLISVGMFLVGGLYLLGGRFGELYQGIGMAAAFLIGAFVHFIGLGILKPVSAVNQASQQHLEPR